MYAPAFSNRDVYPAAKLSTVNNGPAQMCGLNQNMMGSSQPFSTGFRFKDGNQL